MRRTTKYLAFVRMGVVRGLTERGELYGRMLFVPVILGVFSALWGAVGEGSPATLVATPRALVWYLAITEWVVLSAPLIYVDIQADIERGDIAVQLPRPVSYLGAMFCQALGMLAVRAAALGVLVGSCACLWTGSLPPAQVLAYALPFGLCAQVLIVAMYVCIGVAAFWFSDVTPLYWVWQKALFILGGLMLPLELFPRWVERFGALTPFPSLLSGPGGFALHAPSATYALSLALRLALWLAIVAAVAQWSFSRALRRLQVNGG